MPTTASCIEPNTPTPCIPVDIGDCPHFEESESSASSSSLPECPYPGPYRGIINYQRPWFGEDRANFTMGTIVQYFYVLSYKSPVWQHSHLAFTWDPLGHFKYVELDNNKVPRTILWDKDDPKEQQENEDKGSSDSSSGSSSGLGCDILPKESSVDVSEMRQKANVVVRVMALRGTYGCMNPDASSKSSDTSSNSYAPGPPYVPVLFPQEELICSDPDVSAVDSTLTNLVSELAMVIDPAGHLLRVHWGGTAECEANPCVWNREDAPPGMANVVVPVMQSNFRLGANEDCSFDIWLLHFDPLGHYMFASAYVRICCCPTCSHRWCESSDMPQPFCVCRDLCLITEGCEGLASSPATCPATVSINCELALIEECISAISSPGNCVYTWTLQCCPLPVTDPDVLVSSLADASDVTIKGCLYIGESATMTCETHRSEVSESSA